MRAILHWSLKCQVLGTCLLIYNTTARYVHHYRSVQISARMITVNGSTDLLNSFVSVLSDNLTVFARVNTESRMLNEGSMSTEPSCSTELTLSWNQSTDATNKTVDGEFSFLQVPQIIFLSVLLLVIIIGNMCVLTAISLSENGRKTRMNFFIMHLAIADLSVGLFLVTLDIGEKIAVDWVAGAFLCKSVQYLKALVLYASTYVLVSLSIDRFDAIARPMNFSRRVFRAKMLIMTAWLLSAVFAAPSFVLFDTKDSGYVYEGKNLTLCTITQFREHWHWKVYVTVIAVAAFILPALIITLCYSIIISVIWKKSYRQPESIRDNVLPSGRVVMESRARQFSTTSNVIQQAKVRTVKMTFIIVIVFVLCWCPYFITMLVQVFIPVTHSNEGNDIITFMMSLAPMNSAANPIIYGVFSTRICRNLRGVPGLCRISKCICCLGNTRHRTISRLSHTSVLDGTYMTDGSVSTKYGFQKPPGMKRTFSDSDSNYIAIGRQKNGYVHHSTTSIKNHVNGKDTKQNQKILKRGVSIDMNSLYNSGSRRRPSGLPLVKRALSEEDTILLKSVSVRNAKSNAESEI